MMEVILQFEAWRSRSEKMEEGSRLETGGWLGLAFEENGSGYSSVYLAGRSDTHLGICSSQDC